MSDTTAIAWAHPEIGEDEDYVDYLRRAADFYCENPPPAGEHIRRIECDAEPRHWPTYEVKTDDFYPAPCLYCAYDALRAQMDAKERQTHWLDHPIRGRAVSKVLSWAYSMGIIASYGLHWGGPAHCSRCVTSVRFKGRRPYILGRERDPYRASNRLHRWIIARRLGLRCLVCNRRAGYGGTCPNPEHNG